jgi:hypothetical protein
MCLTHLKKVQILNVLNIVLVMNKFFNMGFWQTMLCGRIKPLYLPLKHKPSSTKCNYAHVTYILHTKKYYAYYLFAKNYLVRELNKLKLPTITQVAYKITHNKHAYYIQ